MPRFAHLVEQSIVVLQPVSQLLIVSIVSYGGLVVYLSLPCFVAWTVDRFLPRCVRAHPFFWFTLGLQFAHCADSICVALSFEPLYRYIKILPLAYPFLVATFRYAAKALAFLHGMICSSVKTVQSLLPAAQSCSARRRARKAAKKALAAAAVAVAAPAAQAPVAAKAVGSSRLARRRLRRAAKKA